MTKGCAICGEPANRNGKCTGCQREYMRQYRASKQGGERSRAAGRAAYARKQASDPGHQARATAKWRAENPEVHAAQSRAYVARRRARLAGAQAQPFTQADLFAYWDDIGAYACVYCGAPWEHADHEHPLCLGGAHALWNLVPACAPCNRSKGGRSLDNWLPGHFARRRGASE
jgi:5-methylcytosine-specific restriction endonuclease McrA